MDSTDVDSEEAESWSELAKIGDVVERRLHEHGFKSVSDIAEADIKTLRTIPSLGPSAVVSLYEYVEENEESQVNPADRDPNILPDGAEIHFKDDRDAHVPDRIEFLPGGFVKAIYKQSYKIDIYPQDAIDGIYTHTNHLEDEEWW